MPHSQEMSERYSEERNLSALTPGPLLRKNAQFLRIFLRRKIFKPYFKGLCIRMICFYQKYLSHGTCLYTPTCSEYALQALRKYGPFKGGWLALKRILDMQR